jgi:hypothetical protein
MQHEDAEHFAATWAHTVTSRGSFANLLAPGIDPAPFEERTAEVHARLGPLTVTVDDIVCEGERIAWRWTLRAASATLTGVNFQRLKEGRLVEHWTLSK